MRDASIALQQASRELRANPALTEGAEALRDAHASECIQWQAQFAKSSSDLCGIQWPPIALMALMFFVSARAMACPMCAAARELTISAQELVYAGHSVLAIPVADRNEFRVVAVIKGDTPLDNTISAPVFRADAVAMQSQKPLLLVRDDAWPVWVNFGPINADQAGWLRQLSATKRTTDMTDEEWREHVVYFLPYLENPEPMVAEIAFNEFVSAPYDALRSLKSRLNAAVIRGWLNNPNLVGRRSVYLLLLGIAGTPLDALRIEGRMGLARQTHDVTDLPALIGADLELRGPAGVERIEKQYLTDAGRNKAEIEAALVALRVHGDTEEAVPRSRVIQAFVLFIREQPSLAGLVAAKLAEWNDWDVVPEYTALLESGAPQDPASRDAITKYLENRPNPDVKITPGSASIQ